MSQHHISFGYYRFANCTYKYLGSRQFVYLTQHAFRPLKGQLWLKFISRRWLQKHNMCGEQKEGKLDNIILHPESLHGNNSASAHDCIQKKIKKYNYKFPFLVQLTITNAKQ